jgi:hypothetical protein
MSTPSPLLVHSETHLFSWDLANDQAQLTRSDTRAEIWRGSLLPLFWLIAPEGQLQAVKTRVRVPASGFPTQHAATTLTLEVGRFGVAELSLRVERNSVRLERLEVNWHTNRAPAVHSLYFGADVLTPEQRPAVPTLDLPFWPNWRAEGFAVASAKTNPMQSFFRSWDFGHANIALGSFGPAMGTPYSAAFPRPTYGACAGGRNGWMCFGAGTVPDAALTFQLRARSGALEWRCREDLWGPPDGTSRLWENPLWITWANTAWEAYRDYFRLFPAASPTPAMHQKSFWGTWGDFRLGEFEWRSTVDRAVDVMEADLVCIDDPWEAQKGSCRPHPQRLPNFTTDLAYAHERKLGVGIWMPTGWIENYEAEGLSTEDLLLNREGMPVRSNWAVDPHESGQAFFCLDPSTAGTKRFLRERTQRVIRDYRPTLLKIDFAYGIPGPDACAARDPAVRGERIGWSYLRLIADAARELDPSVTILGYSIHPLWMAVQDQVALDDLGDAGVHEASSHGHWSIWAALAADRGMALMGSSGYIWSADTEVLLNSAILGAPGANLSRAPADATPPPAAHLAQRRGLFRWFRRRAGWTPLWLDSAVGSLEEEPTPRNWGRLEHIGNETHLTALALREPSPRALAAPELRGLRWTGRWILLAQDDRSIFDSRSLALIPLTIGTLSLPRATAPRAVRQVFAYSERDHSAWQWKNGLLEITASGANAGEPTLGLIVEA